MIGGGDQVVGATRGPLVLVGRNMLPRKALMTMHKSVCVCVGVCV